MRTGTNLQLQVTIIVTYLPTLHLLYMLQYSFQEFILFIVYTSLRRKLTREIQTKNRTSILVAL